MIKLNPTADGSYIMSYGWQMKINPVYKKKIIKLVFSFMFDLNPGQGKVIYTIME